MRYGLCPSLWAHLGKELGVRAPELASLKALYGRRSTLFEHQQLAEHTLGFRGITEHQNRAFVQVLRNEAARLPDKDQMLVFARRWLCDHKCLIESKRAFNTQITTALDLFETQTGEIITATVPNDMLDKCCRTLAEFRPDGQIQQSWLWEAPACDPQEHRQASSRSPVRAYRHTPSVTVLQEWKSLTPDHALRLLRRHASSWQRRLIGSVESSSLTKWLFCRSEFIDHSQRPCHSPPLRQAHLRAGWRRHST